MGNATQLVSTGGVLRFANANTSASASTLWADCPMSEWLHDPSIGVYFYDDFLSYHTTALWTSVLTDSGTSAITTGLGGYVSLVPSDGTVADNDEANIYGTSLAFQVQAGKDLWWECELAFAEANTDDINVIAGLASTGAADTLQDDGDGPPANYDGLVWFKVDGGTTWNVEASVAVSQATQDTAITRAASTRTRLGGHVYGNQYVTFFHNGAAAYSTTTLPTATIRPLCGVKNGDTNNENLTVNWFRAFQLR